MYITFHFAFQAREAYLRRYNLKENYDDTFTTVLGLHFDVAKYHFLQGEMILKCTSSLLSVYWQSSEVSTLLPILIKASDKVKFCFMN